MKLKTKPRRPVRLKDVARASGLSVPTVSQALADHPRISLETKQLVRRCCARLGYRRRQRRPGLAGGDDGAQKRLRRVGFLLLGDVLQAPHNASFLHELGTAAAAGGLGLQFAALDSQAGLASAPERAMELARQTDGLILMGLVDRVLLTTLNAAAVPHVVVGHTMESMADLGTPMVCYDEVGMGYTATEALLRVGRRRIAFVCEALFKGLSHWRWRLGYMAALSEAGVPVDPGLICVCGATAGSGERAADTVLALKEHPEAYVIPGVPLAMSFSAAMARRGVPVERQRLVVSAEPVTLRMFQAEAYPHLGVPMATLAAAGLEQLRRAFASPGQLVTSVQVPFTCANLPAVAGSSTSAGSAFL